MHISNLETVKRLGEGHEGTTWLEQDRVTGEFCARKELRSWTAVGTQPLEIHIRRYCMPRHHQNLLDFYGWHFIRTNAGEQCNIYYEYCAGGDLGKLIPKGHPATHPESFIWHIFIQLAEALDAMHNCGPQHVVHGDVKPDNVFLTSPYRSNHSYPAVKLGDYGFAVTTRVSDACGACSWMAPEMECSAKSDVWALGAIIHALCHGFGPVSEAHRGWKHDPRARRPEDLPSKYSDRLNHRMMSCLRVHPRDRPDSETLVRRLHRERPRAH